MRSEHLMKWNRSTRPHRIMARHMGGEAGTNRRSIGRAISGVAFSAGALFQYVSFDYLWWVRLHTSWFVCSHQTIPAGRPMGAAIGLGMLGGVQGTKAVAALDGFHELIKITHMKLSSQIAAFKITFAHVQWIYRGSYLWLAFH